MSPATQDHLSTAWRKSRRSGPDDQCVEVAGLPDGVAVRDSKKPGGAHLAFQEMEWKAFTHRVKRGAFDRAPVLRRDHVIRVDTNYMITAEK